MSAQFLLGTLYEEGRVAEKNITLALEWYKKAAEQGYQDALEQLTRAATHGNKFAQSSLGIMYEQGRGVDQDLKLAFQWFEKSGKVKDIERVGQRLLILDNAKKIATPTSSLIEQKSPKTFTSPKLETNLAFSFTLNYEELKLGKVIGQGGFGVVYEGDYRHNKVAVKQLHLKTPSHEASEEFKQEMHLMANLRCPQIVQLYGIYAEPSYGIVMEYMPNGSLYSVLHSNKPLEWLARCSIAMDMSKGVAFLHKENILHRDLKSLNVLLDKHMQARLTDFGLAKVKNETSSLSSNNNNNNNQVAGTLLWMAPELFKRRATCTKQSDVYSLGMTLWELASRELPFKDATSKDLIPKWVSEGEREEIPKDTPAKIAKMITWCWDGEAAKRPTADQVVEGLKLEDDNDNSQSLNSGPRYLSNFAST